MECPPLPCFEMKCRQFGITPQFFTASYLVVGIPAAVLGFVAEALLYRTKSTKYPLGLLRERQPGLPRCPNRQRIWLGSCNGSCSHAPTYKGKPTFQPSSQTRHAELKTSTLENLRLELRNRFEGFELDEDTSPEDE